MSEKVRFITKWRYEVPGSCPLTTFDRVSEWAKYEKSCGVHIALLENELPMRGLVQGSYETDNARHIEILLKVRGPLKCVNPQAVVDLGVKTAAEMKAMGFDVHDKGYVPPAPKQPAPKAKVDFDTMSKDDLMKLAMSEGIKLDGRMNKDKMLEAYKDAKGE